MITITLDSYSCDEENSVVAYVEVRGFIPIEKMGEFEHLLEKNDLFSLLVSRVEE